MHTQSESLNYTLSMARVVSSTFDVFMLMVADIHMQDGSLRGHNHRHYRCLLCFLVLGNIDVDAFAHVSCPAAALEAAAM